MVKNWAIVAGINQYRFLQPLKYAKRDAETMSNFLKEEGKFDRIFLFTDDSPPINGKPTDPIRNNLLRVLRQIFQAPFMRDGDSFWFFFSGHGIPHNGQDYLMPLDGDPEDVENTGISTNLITNYLRNCGADNTVMILDACRSNGKKSGEGIGRGTSREARQTGVISFFSCSPNEYSYELEVIEQGVFTYSLIEGLGTHGRCATVKQLDQYLGDRVSDLLSQHLKGGNQTPYTIVEPLNRSHLILMSQYATSNDITTLKNDAYRAELKRDWILAERLWIRVLAATAGLDEDAVEALKSIVSKRNAEAITSHPDIVSKPSKVPDNLTAEEENTSQRASPVISVNLAPSIHRLLTLIQKDQPIALPIKIVGRRQFLKWGISGIVSGGVVAIASRLQRNQTQRNLINLPEPSPIHPSLPSTPLPDFSTSARDTQLYFRLKESLENKEWEKADQETASLILRSANRVQENFLDDTSIQSFSCEILSNIDRQWIENSDGKFGFSVQMRIYLEECDGRFDESCNRQTWERFCRRVGWLVDNRLIAKSEANFSTSADQGHLPFYQFYDVRQQLYDLLFRVKTCIL